jgi:hypothetical protein
MKSKILLLLTAVAVVAALPAASGAAGSATAASFTSTVVAKDRARNTVTLASATGVVRTLRAPKQVAKVRIGQRVAVRALELRDGTFGVQSLAVKGRAKAAKVRGVLIRNDRKRGRYVISAASSTIVVKRAKAVRTTASLAASGPKVGDRVVAVVDISAQGTLEEDDLDVVGHIGELDFEGEFVGRSGDSIRIAVAPGHVLTAIVPAGFKLPALRAGDQVEAEVAVSASGAFTLLELEVEDENCTDGSSDSSKDSSSDSGDSSSDSSHDWSSCDDEDDEDDEDDDEDDEDDDQDESSDRSKP